MKSLISAHPSHRSRENSIPLYPTRRRIFLAGFLVLAAILVFRVIDLTVYKKNFLQHEGDARHLRVVKVPAHRGMITDRYGEALAISTPVDAIWMNPQNIPANINHFLSPMAALLGVEVSSLEKKVRQSGDKGFVYLKRQVSPNIGRQIETMKIPGVYRQTEYRRFYPTAEVSAHVLGFTNIDDSGQEGLELSFNEWLTGTEGKKRVIRDRLGNIVKDLEVIEAPHDGKDLAISLDRRIQYIAYRELKSAVMTHRAESGSIVILDANTGEVLAMVNQPAFNPNDRHQLKGVNCRNRAVTDTFEPGSTMKPFTIAAALESGRYRASSQISTGSGRFIVAGNVITDVHNYGTIDVTRVLTKSSNIGASKIALSLPAEKLWRLFTGVGFGLSTGSTFPGEATGMLPYYQNWYEIDHATIAFGYGLSTTTLQLAQAYAVLANGGVSRPVSFLHQDNKPRGERVLPERIVKEIQLMLEGVVSREGTGYQAQVPGFRVAGKTGTVKKLNANGYERRYISLFAGFAPVSNPRLVMVVTIDDPQGDDYYGGKVAAPIFAKVMGDALRLLNIPPDAIPQSPKQPIYTAKELIIKGRQAPEAATTTLQKKGNNKIVSALEGSV